MKCVCEILDNRKFSIEGKIAILESKAAAMEVFGLRNASWLDIWGIDPRILTVFYQSSDPEYDWYIVVYDYPAFCLDEEIKEAIIWHELGHIEHPVHGKALDLESEILCDRLASQNGCKTGMEKILDITLGMALALKNDLLAAFTAERLKRLQSI